MGFQGKFPKGSLEIHESIGYTDRALELFFEEAKKQNWYKNTMFIITADHTQKPSQKFGRKISDYRVPLIFFHPNRTIKGVDTNMVTSQSAIGSSLIDLLDFDSQWTFFGPSIFRSNEKNAFAFLRKGEDFYLVQNKLFHTLNKK